MNFKQACEMMKQGHKVYRLNNSCDWYMRKEIYESEDYSKIVICNFEDSFQDMDQTMYFSDLDAKDWEIIDEEEYAKGILKPFLSWEEVSAAIEKADSEHCAALEKNVAVKGEE